MAQSLVLCAYAVTHNLCEALAQENSTPGTHRAHDTDNGTTFKAQGRESLLYCGHLCLYVSRSESPREAGGVPSITRQPQLHEGEVGIQLPSPQKVQSPLSPTILRIQLRSKLGLRAGVWAEFPLALLEAEEFFPQLLPEARTL